jgi:lysophospholipase L1-like esterase
MVRLETYEWCDFWWDRTGDLERERVLLIGDSITRAYRPHVNGLLKERACVDMLATSKAVDNPSLLQEIGYIAGHEPFTYRAIHINNGLHGWHLSEQQYEQDYDKVICFIQERVGTARIVLATTTPITVKGNREELDPEINERVRARNRAAERLASKYDLTLHDLYTPMIGRSEYRVDDGYHYNADGQKAQAELVALAIGSWLTK